MKALVGAFNQEKALVGAFSVIVKSSGTFGSPSFQALLPGHQLLRGELALRRPRGAAGASGHRARAGPHRAAGCGAQPRQVSQHF